MKVLLILITMTISFFGFAGGGGSSSGGGGSSGGGSSSSFSGGSSSYSSGSSYGSGGSNSSGTWGDFLFFTVMLFIFIFVVTKGSTSHNSSNTSDQNNTEQEKWIHKEAERIFVQYQQDWSDYNLESIKSYTTDEYFQHASLMLEAIDCMNRRNVVSDLLINKTILRTPVNDETKLPITVQVKFRFCGTDSLVSTSDAKKSSDDSAYGKIIYSDDASGVEEYWDYVYDGTSLKLNGITQSTESTPHLLWTIAEFAQENNMFYSPDWGRLALPTRGLLFDGYDVLRCADVNNHVVGKWNNCLVQIYTYSAIPGEPDSYYIIGQINVPKSYEGVIVEAENANLSIAKPKDYDKFDMEWVDFNSRYNVFAASRDALPAFELLNPKFMERLYERNLPYNLEVKDNVIYIFARVEEAEKEDYVELLNVLSEAFDELKM